MQSQIKLGTMRGAVGTMSRRQAVAAIGLASTWAVLGHGAEPAARRSGMGLVLACRTNLNGWRRKQNETPLSDAATFLEHCASLGAGGMQVGLGSLDTKEAHALRARAEALGLYIEANIKVPKDEGAVGRFEADVRRAAEAGARAVCTTILPGRRYEYFESLAHFKELDALARRSVELAAPIVEKHRVPLAIENHKDHRNAERVALFEHISSEYVGACVDTGNSYALLEDPIETVEALAPWAFALHLKEQAVQPYADGFILDDVPLGQGFFDLKRMVDIIRAKKPDIRFSLELITREPINVPVFNDSYWRTFPDVPATDLARTLRLARDGASELQYVNQLSTEARIALEEQNVLQSLDYAAKVLEI